jgi:hypothetical protein
VIAELAGVAGLDLTRYIRPGDTVTWGQGCGEPLSLTEALAAQRADLTGTRCFLGISCADTFRPEHADHLRFVSYSGSGPNQAVPASWTCCPATTQRCPRRWPTGRCKPTW